MKRFGIVVLGLLLAAVVFAADVELTYLHEGDVYYKDVASYWKDTRGFISMWQKLIYNFEKETPGFKVRPVLKDLSTGSNFSLDAMLAAGKPPDVYLSGIGMVAKLLNDSYALQPDKYGSVADWTEDSLNTCRIAGKLYGLPAPAAIMTGAINVDILKSIGYTLPATDKWTIDEFYSLAKKLKAAGKYGTVLFAKNQSSDHWWMSWFMAFGAKLFTNNDYTKTTLNSPQAVEALNYLKKLVDEQLVPPNPGELDDDMALDLWCKGEVALLMMQIGHTAIVDSYVKQGILPKAFEFTFCELPHAASLKHAPSAIGAQVVVAHKSKDEKRNKAVAKLLFTIGGYEQQYHSGMGGNFPNMKSVLKDIKVGNPYWNIVKDIVAASGTWDRGNILPSWPEFRAVMFPLMQEFYAGRLTAQEVLSKFETGVNKILKGK